MDMIKVNYFPLFCTNLYRERGGEREQILYVEESEVQNTSKQTHVIAPSPPPPKKKNGFAVSTTDNH